MSNNKTKMLANAFSVVNPFLSGYAQAIDMLGGLKTRHEILNNHHAVFNATDSQALANDWKIVGDDLGKAIEQVTTEFNGSKKEL